MSVAFLLKKKCVVRGQVGNVEIENKAERNKSHSKHAFNCLGAFLTNPCLTLGLASYC